jgi:hypothetical protein
LRQQAETGTCSEQNRNVQITTIIKAGWNDVPPGLLLFLIGKSPCAGMLTEARTKNEI